MFISLTFRNLFYLLRNALHIRDKINVKFGETANVSCKMEEEK